MPSVHSPRRSAVATAVVHVHLPCMRQALQAPVPATFMLPQANPRRVVGHTLCCLLAPHPTMVVQYALLQARAARRAVPCPSRRALARQVAVRCRWAVVPVLLAPVARSTWFPRTAAAVPAARCRSRAALRPAAAPALFRSRRVRRAAVRAALFRCRLVRATLARAVLPRLRRAARRLATPRVVTCRSRPAAAAVAAAACVCRAVLARLARVVVCR